MHVVAWAGKIIIQNDIFCLCIILFFIKQILVPIQYFLNIIQNHNMSKYTKAMA